VVILSDKKTNEQNKELQSLRKEKSELFKEAKRDYYQEMISQWRKLSAYFIIGMGILSFIVFLVVYSIPMPSPDTVLIERSRIEGIADVIFTVTIAVNGIMIGIVPLCCFFFIREVREEENMYKRDWKEERNKGKGDRLELINRKYWLLSVIGNNLISGVLTYTKTFVSWSITLLFASIAVYFSMATLGLDLFFITINLIIFSIIFFGILPVINISLYRPYLRPVKYIYVEKEFVTFEPKN